MCTAGIAALSQRDQIVILALVRSYDAFDGDNDPHGERDFGTIFLLHDGNWTTAKKPRNEEGRHSVKQRIFWKIDYYDTGLRFGSEAPEDAAKTTRVLTVMLAEEY